MGALRLAIIGCGSITERGFLPHLALERDRVKVVALCDVKEREAHLKTLAERFNVKETFTDVADLFSNSDAEAVAIATPIPLHYQQALATLLGGRHVYVQKTMTQTTEEAKELIRLADERGLVLAASPGQMLLPAYRYARKLIVDEEALGTVYAAIGVTMAPGHEYEASRKKDLDPSWYLKAGGGPLRDMGVYSIHAITGILGYARRVTSFASRPRPERQWENKKIQVEADDNVVLILALEQACLATISASYSAIPPILHWGHLAISGFEGALEVRRLPEKSSRYELVLRRTDRSRVLREEFGTGLGEEHDALEEAHVARDLLDFVDAALNNRPAGASAKHACHTIAVIEAAERSTQIGRAVEIPRFEAMLDGRNGKV